MASENETVEDILKEIRQVGPYAVYEKPIFTNPKSVSESYLKRFMYGQLVTDYETVIIENPKVKEVSNYSLADRIESAWRRERELIGTPDWNKCAMCQNDKTGEGYGEIPPPVGYDYECDECEIAKRLRSGKPRPKRNCDRFATAEEAYNACPQFCDIDVKTMSDCELKIVEATIRGLEWIFAPCEEGGAR